MVKTGTRVIVPQFLAAYTGDVTEVVVHGGTVGDCLFDFIKQFPQTSQHLVDGHNRLLGHIDVYINRESTYPEELLKQVNEGDEMRIVNALSGG